MSARSHSRSWRTEKLKRSARRIEVDGRHNNHGPREPKAKHSTSEWYERWLRGEVQPHNVAPQRGPIR